MEEPCLIFSCLTSFNISGRYLFIAEKEFLSKLIIKVLLFVLQNIFDQVNLMNV